MSADLTLFAIDPGDLVLRGDVARYRAADWICDDPPPNAISFEDASSVITRLCAYPHVEVGQVSWLKAALFEQHERYIPGPVERCAQIIGDGVLLSDGMAKAITVAFNVPNRSVYGRVTYTRVRDPQWLGELRYQARGARREPWSPALRRPNIAVHAKDRGVASARVVKRFVQANLGAWVVHLSV